MNAEIMMTKKQRVDHMIQQFIQNTGVPGLSIGIVHEHEIIVAEGYGVKNIETKEPVHGNTLFHMASVSKTFVASAVMQLVEKGAISLDSKIADLIPYFRMDDERACEITVFQLLNHTSGMPDEEDYEWHSPVYEEYALEHYVRGISDKKLDAAPGEQFSYSNIGYEILGHLVSRISGLPFETYMKEHLLNPMGMVNSDFYKPNVKAELIASPHVFDAQDSYGTCVSKIFPYHRAHGPSSTLLSSAKEMCEAALHHLATSTTGRGFPFTKSASILDSKSYKEMWSPQAKTSWGGHMSDVGCSWFIGDYKGARVLSHSGMDTGFRSNFLLLPDTGSAVIIMCNADHVGIQVLSRTLMDIVLGEEPEYIPYAVARPLAEIMVHQGMDQAVATYEQMISTLKAESLLIIEGEFEAIAEEFVEVHREKEALNWKMICRKVLS
ncbi:serine hydrolase domain-containing protein [Paenibacillus sp. Marseille-Q4541]|uniref:serine hydrolase domain-containing protein n=1 Tax=Paenibacillus sp. Marseille-Q4541 TaxID=2831522 RepID=UPI001BACEEF7|nr:serine hydrolase domain-containing protein [Paenibacillus sp. Marseille-Q4541]